ncbi:MAG: universal stress protein [Spartobacteria bacterium]
MALPPKTLSRRPARLTNRSGTRPRPRPRAPKAPTLRLRRVLVPTDFSPAANAVLPAAVQWCEGFRAELHLVHVCEVDFYAPSLMVAPRVVPRSKIKKEARSHLQELAREQGSRLHHVRIHVSEGRPHQEICRLARELDADLIMTATRGRTGLKHLTLGSTAERVIRHAPCPVLALHPPLGPARLRAPVLRKILVPIDFSAAAAQGLAYARALAAQFRARLILLHSVDLHYYSTNPDYVLLDLPPLLAAAEKAGDEQMRELVDQTDWQGLKVEPTVERGHVGAQVCRRAREMGADLIVTSTHGRTGLKRVLLGSTAEYIVRHASCPVLVVPSHLQSARTTRQGGRE